jgi:hypothetical protein
MVGNSAIALGEASQVQQAQVTDEMHRLSRMPQIPPEQMHVAHRQLRKQIAAAVVPANAAQGGVSSKGPAGPAMTTAAAVDPNSSVDNLVVQKVAQSLQAQWHHRSL